MADQNFQRFIMAIVVVGIVLIIGIFISAELQDVMTDAASGSITNETTATVTELGINLAVYNYDDVTCTITYVMANASGATGYYIDSNNYTQTDCNLAFTGADVVSINNTAWNVTYTHAHRDSTVSSNASGDLVTALSGGTAWITILVVVGFAVIVLGMLTSGLGRAAMGAGAPPEAAYTY